jgi:HSP20 family protein
MLTRWGDLDRTFSVMDELRRRMDRVFDEYGGYPYARPGLEEETRASAAWPRLNLLDTGAALVVTAEVPGVADKDVNLTINQDVVTLSGVRNADAPEGYAVHRQERAAVKFSRSFALPTKIDAEKTSATMKNGILTITMAKAPEAQPKQIAVRAQ